MIDFTDAVASLGEYDAGIGACADADTANANESSAPRATVGILNFNFSILRGRTVLEKLAVVLVAIRRLARATFREPSIGYRIRQRNSARVNRPGPAVDGGLIEYPAAAPARECEPRAAARGY
jgi:alpha/beta superfamily hydrolase